MQAGLVVIGRAEPGSGSGDDKGGMVVIIAALRAGSGASYAVNLPNRGQVPDLPLGAIVATWGIAMSLAIPALLGDLGEHGPAFTRQGA